MVAHNKYQSGRKFDKGKPRWCLLPWKEIEEVVKVLTKGSEKYSIKKEMHSNSVLSYVQEELELCKNVLTVKKINISTAEDYVDHATKSFLKKEIQNTLNVKENSPENGEKEIENGAITTNKKEIKTQKEESILKDLREYLHLKKLVSQKNQPAIFYKNKKIDVESVDVLWKISKRILIIVIQQETHEDIYVVGATTDSECLVNLLHYLKKQYNIFKTHQLHHISQDNWELIYTGNHNWQKVPDRRNRYFSAALRHIKSWWEGEVYDDINEGGDGYHHLAHAICCLLFLMWDDNNEGGQNELPLGGVEHKEIKTTE